MLSACRNKGGASSLNLCSVSDESADTGPDWLNLWKERADGIARVASWMTSVNI